MRLRWLDDPDEWPLLRDVRLAALRADPGAFLATLAEEQALAEDDWRRRAGAGTTLLAQDPATGAPAGTAACVAEPGAPADERHLVAMWVAPSARGTGLAGRLVAAVADRARADGARTLTLWVVRDNAAARTAYARAGLVEVPVPPGVADHACSGEVRMALPLR